MNPIVLVMMTSLAPSAPTLPAFWGGDGHKLICEIAWSYLTPDARTLIQTVRQSDPPGSFAETCTWADEVRNARPETSAYHFINIPSNAAGVDLDRDCGDVAKRCAPWAIKHYTVILANRSASATERLEALKFLSHFVGDLHQPLHAGRLADLGGNTVRVGFFGDRGSERSAMNLHRIWDSMLPARAGLTYPASAQSLIASITAQNVAHWSNADVLGWTNESYQVAEGFVYSVPNGGDVGQAYFDEAVPIVKLRMQQAGVRLAFVLNEAARGRAVFSY